MTHPISYKQTEYKDHFAFDGTKFEDGMCVFLTVHKRYNESVSEIGTFAISKIKGNYSATKITAHFFGTLFLLFTVAYSGYGIYHGLMTIFSLK